MIGHKRLQVIAAHVASMQPGASCAGHYVLAAQELLYGSWSTLLSRAEWEELNAFLAERQTIPGAAAANV